MNETLHSWSHHQKKHYGEWILNSACSYHMSPNKHLFSRLEEFDGGVVFMGNNNVSEVELETSIIPIKTVQTIPTEGDSDESSDEEDATTPATTQQESIAMSKPKRVIKKPARYCDMVAYALPVIDDGIPYTYKKSSTEWGFWTHCGWNSTLEAVFSATPMVAFPLFFNQDPNKEWLGYISSEPRPESVRLVTIPNVIPPERLKAVDFPGFYEAVMTKMEAPFEQLLDQFEIPVTAIIGDIENQKSPPNLSGQVDLHPGISSSHLAELQKVFQKNDQRVLQLALECISKVPQAQYLLFTSIYELEPQVMDTMKDTFQFPVYPIGPAIPYLELEGNLSGTNYSHMAPDYLQWLDSQPKDSVLYISLGSFLSVSSTQMDEIIAGLQDSGVRYLWVARGEASRLKDICSDDMGLVLPWCDQLKVLCHSSIGGFWTHCGWNSTLEAVFAGVPMLTFPLFLDQEANSKQILEVWGIGWKVKRGLKEEKFLTREEIAELVQKFMDLESNEGKEMRRRARELGNICQQGIAEGGSSTTNLDAFIRDISLGIRH
uniref:Retrovirus-related Pol polyprotein from transposon TNT 1-94-like beta-barrel domain-containing protein n=1 Tax=Populus alba TaxID=43335 RepID=A0A4U5QCJ1_POPAL|nr:hypothetical protein D5086_0000109420 [Populus alba]